MRASTVALDEQYRNRMHPAAFDLSSSSPPALTVADLTALAANATDIVDLGLGYERSGGSEPLRRLVAGMYEGLTPDDILITAGASEAIRAAIAPTILHIFGLPAPSYMDGHARTLTIRVSSQFPA